MGWELRWVENAQGALVRVRVWVPDPPPQTKNTGGGGGGKDSGGSAGNAAAAARAAAERARRRAAAAAAAKRAAAEAAARKRREAERRAAQARAAAEAAARARIEEIRRRRLQEQARLAAEQRAEAMRMDAQRRAAAARTAAYDEIKRRQSAVLRQSGLVPPKKPDTRLRGSKAGQPTPPPTDPGIKTRRMMEEAFSRRDAIAEEQRKKALLEAEKARWTEYGYQWKKRMAAGGDTNATTIEEILAEEAKRAAKGLSDPRVIGVLTEKYIAMAEQVSATYKTLVQQINALLDKGDLKAARELYFGEFQRVAKEYVRLFGDGSNPEKDGAFNAYFKNYAAVDEAQREWWKRQIQATLDSDRASVNDRIHDLSDEIRKANQYGEGELARSLANEQADLTRLSEVYAGKTSTIVWVDADGVRHERKRTVEEELEYREAQRRIEMERLRAQMDAGKRRTDMIARAEGLAVGADGSLQSYDEARIQRDLLAYVRDDLGGKPPNLQRPQDIVDLGDKMMSKWTKLNPKPKAPAGGNRSPDYSAYLARLKVWEASKDKYEKSLYAFYGSNPPALWDRVFGLPGVSHGLSALQAGVASIGAGGRVVLKATTGQSAIDLGVNVSELPDGIRQRVAAAVAAWDMPKDQWGGSVGINLVGSQVGRATKDQLLTEWFKTPEGAAWLKARTALLQKKLSAEDKAFLAGFYGEGDIGTKLDALNQYGSTPFANSDIHNLLFQLLADPTNAIPLKFTTYLARAKFAGEAGNASKWLGSSKLGSVRDFVKVDEGTLRLQKQLDKLMRESEVGGKSARQLAEELLLEVGGIAEKSARDKAIRAKLIAAGFAPRLVNDTQLFNLIESAIKERLATRGIDYNSQAAIQKRLSEADAAAKRAQRAARSARLKGLKADATRAQRQRFARRVVAAHGKEAEGYIAPKHVAPYVEDAVGLAVEKARTFHATLKSAAPGHAQSIVRRLGPKRHQTYFPPKLFEEANRRVSAAIAEARGFRADTRTAKRGPGLSEEFTSAYGRQWDSDPVVIAAKQKVLGELGISVAAYDEALKVLRPGHRQGLAAEYLMNEARRIAKATGEEYKDVYKRLRAEEAAKEGRRQLGGLAFDTAGLSPAEVMAEFAARYGDDGMLRKDAPRLSAFQRRTLEEYVAHLAGTKRGDQAGVEQFLGSRNLPPLENRTLTREFLEDIGAWSPRTAEQITEGAKSWSVTEEAQFWASRYGKDKVPEWAQMDKLRGELNAMFHDQDFYVDQHRKWGFFSRAAEAKLRLVGDTVAEIEERVINGDPLTGVKGKRELDLIRRYYVERFGDLVGKIEDGEVTLTAMPWMMYPDELRTYYKTRSVKEIASDLIQNADELDEVMALIGKELDDFFDVHILAASAGFPGGKRITVEGVPDSVPIWELPDDSPLLRREFVDDGGGVLAKVANAYFNHQYGIGVRKGASRRIQLHEIGHAMFEADINANLKWRINDVIERMFPGGDEFVAMGLFGHDWHAADDVLRRWMKSPAERVAELYAQSKLNTKLWREIRSLRDPKLIAELDDYMSQLLEPRFKPETRPIEYGDIFKLAARIQARLLANPKWAKRHRDVAGTALNAWATVNRALVFTQFSFLAANVVDVPIKSSWYRWTRRALFNPGLAAAPADVVAKFEKWTPQDLGLDLRSSLYELKGKRPLKDIATQPLNSGLKGVIERYTVVPRFLYRAAPAGAAKVEIMAKMQLAKGMAPQVYAQALRRVKDPELAEAFTRKFVKDEINRMWPTSGDGELERLFNQLVPFASYMVRNKVLFISEAAAHPSILNQIEYIGQYIEKQNRESWERDHPGQPLPDWAARRIELPWAPGYFLDLGQFSDATRGLKPIYNAAKGPMSYKDFVAQWVRIVNPSMQAGIYMLTNALGVTQRIAWEPQLNEDGFVTGYKQVLTGWTEPWSQDQPSWGSVVWVLDVIEDAQKAGLDGKWSNGELSQLLGKLAMFDAIQGVDRGAGLYEYYKAMRDKNKDNAERWLTGTSDGMLLQSWLLAKAGSLKDAKFRQLDILLNTINDPHKFWHSTSPAFQAAVKSARANIERIEAVYEEKLFHLTPGTNEYRQTKAEMLFFISEVYRLTPELMASEVYSKTASEWARQLERWEVNKLTDEFFALDAQRPSRAQYESAAEYNKALEAWRHQKELFLATHPDVAAQLGGARTALEKVKDQVDAEWDEVLTRIGKRNEAIEAAKKLGDQEKLDILYLQNELDFSILERDYVALYFTDDDFQRLPKDFIGPPGLVKDALKKATTILDFDARRFEKAKREGKEQEFLDNLFYANGMKEVISKAKGGDPFGKFDPAVFVAEIKKRPRLMELYFTKNPGKRESWRKTDEYIRLIAPWGQAARRGDWDEAERIWARLPQWVKDRYHSKHPEKRGKATQSAEYVGWLKRWVAHFERDDVKGGMEFFWAMPAWVRERYFAKHPEKRGKWEASLKYGRELAQYFAMDKSGQGQFLAEHPDLQKFLRSEVSDEEKRRQAILAGYRAIPKEEQWLRRIYREKFPEIFSQEALGEQRLRRVYDRLARHPELLPEFEKWVEAIWASYTEMIRHGQKPPRPIQFKRERRRRRSLSAAEVSRG